MGVEVPLCPQRCDVPPCPADPPSPVSAAFTFLRPRCAAALRQRLTLPTSPLPTPSPQLSWCLGSFSALSWSTSQCQLLRGLPSTGPLVPGAGACSALPWISPPRVQDPAGSGNRQVSLPLCASPPSLLVVSLRMSLSLLFLRPLFMDPSPKFIIEDVRRGVAAMVGLVQVLTPRLWGPT